MDKYFKLLKSNALFSNFSLDEIVHLFKVMPNRIEEFRKGNTIIQHGDPVKHVGVVIEGNVVIIQEDLEGNVHIVSQLGVNDIFAEAFVFSQVKEFPVSVVASVDCKILFLDFSKIYENNTELSNLTLKIIKNIISIVARKNVQLNQKMEVLSKRTTREKVSMYLNRQVLQNGSKVFTIPYNREQLALYLCVDRSALSRELSRMKADQLINFYKNSFEVLK